MQVNRNCTLRMKVIFVPVTSEPSPITIHGSSEGDYNKLKIRMIYVFLQINRR